MAARGGEDDWFTVVALGEGRYGVPCAGRMRGGEGVLMKVGAVLAESSSNAPFSGNKEVRWLDILVGNVMVMGMLERFCSLMDEINDLLRRKQA